MGVGGTIFVSCLLLVSLLEVFDGAGRCYSRGVLSEFGTAYEYGTMIRRSSGSMRSLHALDPE